MNTWGIIYEKAIRDDGSLYFPERLSREFLDEQRRTQGTYIYSNQYQNEVVPEGEQRFKPHWLRYYTTLPKNVYHFGFIDPAIGQKKKDDYTAVVVVAVDEDKNWYLRLANRYRATPTQIIQKMFEIHAEFKLQALGIESQAFQEAMLYFSDEEMRRRDVVIPLTGVKRSSDDHKVPRILSLVPRFEFGRVFIAQGLTDFEDEYKLFPRTKDDLLDALQSIEELVFYPDKEKERPIERPASASDPAYEKWYIQNAINRSRDSDSVHE